MYACVIVSTVFGLELAADFHLGLDRSYSPFSGIVRWLHFLVFKESKYMIYMLSDSFDEGVQPFLFLLATYRGYGIEQLLEFLRIFIPEFSAKLKKFWEMLQMLLLGTTEKLLQDMMTVLLG